MHWGAGMSYSARAESLDALGAAEDAGGSLDRALPARPFLREVPTASALAIHGLPILALEGITLSFGGVAAIADVDLRVAQGEIRAIIGPNGAGKSSLINVISGIYVPDRGRVTIGEDTFRQVPTQRLARLGVARTFQNLALFKGLSVLENVAI